MKDTVTSVSGGSFLGIVGGMKWVESIDLMQVMSPGSFDQEWVLKAMATLCLGIIGGFGGLLGKAVYTLIKDFIHHIKTKSDGKR